VNPRSSISMSTRIVNRSKIGEGKIGVVFDHHEHSSGKHQLFEIYEKTTSLVIPSADSNEKNRSSLAKRAISLM